MKKEPQYPSFLLMTRMLKCTPLHRRPNILEKSFDNVSSMSACRNINNVSAKTSFRRKCCDSPSERHYKTLMTDIPKMKRMIPKKPQPMETGIPDVQPKEGASGNLKIQSKAENPPEYNNDELFVRDIVSLPKSQIRGPFPKAEVRFNYCLRQIMYVFIIIFFICSFVSFYHQLQY